MRAKSEKWKIDNNFYLNKQSYKCTLIACKNFETKEKKQNEFKN